MNTNTGIFESKIQRESGSKKDTEKETETRVKAVYRFFLIEVNSVYQYSDCHAMLFMEMSLINHSQYAQCFHAFWP